MSVLFESLKYGLTAFIEDGQYLMLFLVAYLILWLSEGEKNRELRYFATIMFFLVIMPGTSNLLAWYQTSFYSFKDLWELIPVTAFLSVSLFTTGTSLPTLHQA